MQQNITSIIDKILESNFPDSLIKSEYLYNELFISIYSGNNFGLYGISLKSDNLVLDEYNGIDKKSYKILLLIISKYKKIFSVYLKAKRAKLFDIGKESEFINIFDKEELEYKGIEKMLNFSFLDDYTYRRKIQNEFKIANKSILDIYHSDFECSRCSGPKETFTSFPDYSNVLDEKFFQKEKNKNFDQLFTNITDYESITIGGNEKISDILSNKKILEKYDMIALNKTCISVIMGDDLESIFKYNNIPQDKILYTDQNIDSPYRTMINYLKNVDLKPVDKNDEILLIGLPKNKNTFEVISFLRVNFNIKVGNVLLPNIDVGDLEKIADYKLAVFFKGREIKAQKLFTLYPISQFNISMPYGISKFKELIDAILLKLGKEHLMVTIDKLLSDYAIKNNVLFKKAHNFKLGFIIFDFHLRKFLDDDFRGVPILSLLKDMGFVLEFFVHKNDEGYHSDIKTFDKLGFHTIYSNDVEELDRFIDSDINCFYTEISNDTRILSRNKEKFSVGDFEYGLDGFYRTFEILIKRCERQSYTKSKLGYYLN